MHAEILTATQLAVLERLAAAIPAVRDFYLAGGTALALRHGHRRSIDFDFFRAEPFDVQELAVRVGQVFDDEYERLPTGAQTLYLRLSRVTTSFFRYPYRLLEAVEPCRTCSARSTGMKPSASSPRRRPDCWPRSRREPLG